MAVSKLVTLYKAIKDYISFRPKFVNHDILIISPGGVGTTFLMEHVLKFRQVNCPYDTDRLKHLSKRPNARKILYIHGNYDDIYNSLKRRGWVVNQAIKLRSFGALLTAGKVQKWFFVRALRKQDLSMYGPNVYRLNYDEIWNETKEIGAFLEIEHEDFVAQFPSRKLRTPQA